MYKCYEVIIHVGVFIIMSGKGSIAFTLFIVLLFVFMILITFFVLPNV